MKEKFTRIELFYYLVSIYCLWASQGLYAVTVKAQGTAGVSVLGPVLIVLGALSPITTMTSSLPFSGCIVGLYILISPLVGAILYRDYRKKRFGISCMILTAVTTSQVVTGTYYSPSAGVGGLLALFVVVCVFILTILSIAKEEIRKLCR
jgi:hypothetical protein